MEEMMNANQAKMETNLKEIRYQTWPSGNEINS
jgi:hypothetical protein